MSRYISPKQAQAEAHAQGAGYADVSAYITAQYAADVSYADMARELGLSDAAVIERAKRLGLPARGYGWHGKHGARAMTVVPEVAPKPHRRTTKRQPLTDDRFAAIIAAVVRVAGRVDTPAARRSLAYAQDGTMNIE